MLIFSTGFLLLALVKPKRNQSLLHYRPSLRHLLSFRPLAMLMADSLNSKCTTFRRDTTLILDTAIAAERPLYRDLVQVLKTPKHELLRI